MRAALYYGPGDIRFEDVPEPTIGAGDVIVRPLYNGLCGTDLHQYYVKAMAPVPLPIVIGHEFAGEIVEVGPGVSRVAVGDLVAVDPQWRCGTCSACSAGHYHLCFQYQCHGLGASGGGLSELTAVTEAMTFPVPDGVEPAQAALAEPMSVSYHGVSLARPEPGTTAVVLGAGPIGIGCYLALCALGVEDVVVTEPSPDRRAAIARLGAETVLDPTAGDVVGEILEHTRGLGATVAIDAAGTAESFRVGTAVTGRKGRFVTLAAYVEPVAYNPTDLMMREVAILASFSNCGDFAAVLDHMSRGRYPTDGWVEHVPFETHLDAYDRLHERSAMKVLVDL
ncbi:MAG TPA: alcohol dehydrogenase catalytic domain-containing protein [Acidimicrobiia bacterium]